MATEYLIGNVKGIKGDKGETGPIGASPNLTIGTVTTGSSGTQANATITGTTPNLELNLTIPKGDDGITPNEITGNAGTATKLQTARKINGVDFDGTRDINLENLSTTIDLTTLDTNFFYPVRIFGNNLFEINKPFYLGIKNITMLLNFQGTGQSWGSTESYLDMIYLSNGNLTKKVVQFWPLANETVFWLRGGSPYILTSLIYTPFIIYTESTVIHKESNLIVEPEDINGVIPIKNGKYEHCNGINYTNYIIDGNSQPLNYISNSVGQGASLIGISDTANNFTSTNVEGALLELASRLKVLENK